MQEGHIKRRGQESVRQDAGVSGVRWSVSSRQKAVGGRQMSGDRIQYSGVGSQQSVVSSQYTGVNVEVINMQ